LNQIDPQALTKMLETISQYMSTRKESNLPILTVLHSGPNPPDALSEIWLVVQELVENDWVVEILDQGNWSLDIMSDAAIYEVSLIFSLSIQKASLRAPLMPFDDPSKRYPFQGTCFNVFSQENIGLTSHSLTLRPYHVSNYIIMDVIKDILTLYSHNHKECVSYLGRINGLVEGVVKGEAAVKLVTYQFIMNGLIRELLRLPTSNEKMVYYSCIVVGLCRVDPLFPSGFNNFLMI
jgi:hypothetical protein